jgi:pyruvate dehydrogenase E2 component (dihydrolipoamide acetyltransferase)
VINVHIPKMGMSTIEVDIIRVLVAPGQYVRHDQVIVEIDSEKVTYEIVSESAGTIGQVLVKEGDICKVGDIVATIVPA